MIESEPMAFTGGMEQQLNGYVLVDTWRRDDDGLQSERDWDDKKMTMIVIKAIVGHGKLYTLSFPVHVLPLSTPNITFSNAVKCSSLKKNTCHLS